MRSCPYQCRMILTNEQKAMLPCKRFNLECRCVRADEDSDSSNDECPYAHRKATPSEVEEFGWTIKDFRPPRGHIPSSSDLFATPCDPSPSSDDSDSSGSLWSHTDHVMKLVSKEKQRAAAAATAAAAAKTPSKSALKRQRRRLRNSVGGAPASSSHLR